MVYDGMRSVALADGASVVGVDDILTDRLTGAAFGCSDDRPAKTATRHACTEHAAGPRR